MNIITPVVHSFDDFFCCDYFEWKAVGKNNELLAKIADDPRVVDVPVAT
jgi:hypothetical protein